MPNSSFHFPNHKSFFFFRFCITHQCHKRKLLCTFLGQTWNTLHNRNKWKCKFLRLSRVLRSEFVKFLKSILKRQVDSSLNFISLFSVMKDNSSVLFLAQTTYTFLEKSPLKWKILRLSSAQVKICEVPNVNFEKKVDSSPNFVSLFIVMKDNSPVLFFSSNNIYSAQKECIKVNIFETFTCLGKNLSNSSC